VLVNKALWADLLIQQAGFSIVLDS
jgi:hypothetical protein